MTPLLLSISGYYTLFNFLFLKLHSVTLSMQDKREFKKFMEERSKAKWNSVSAILFSRNLLKLQIQYKMVPIATFWVAGTHKML